MKAQLEAEIAALEAQLAEKKLALEAWVANIPAEFHHLTQEVFDKLKAFFVIP